MSPKTGAPSPSRILIYNPLFAQSHANFLSAIGRILTEEGHHVTVLAPVVFPNIRFDETQFTKVIKVSLPEEVIDITTKAFADWNTWTYDNYNFFKVKKLFTTTADAGVARCRAVLDHPGLLDDLQASNFDIGISEYMDVTGIAIFHLLGLKKTILGASTGFDVNQLQAFGIPMATSYISILESGISVDDLKESMWARGKNALLTLMYGYLHGRNVHKIQSFLNERFPEFPHISDLAANCSLILSNTNPLFEVPQPTLHKVIDIGGFHVTPINRTTKTTLSEEWTDILSRRKTNILISFGSVAQSVDMPVENKKAIVELARRFPEMTFIWKYEKPEDEVGRGLDNLVKVAWMPQNELLQSGKLSLFLTHGGIASVTEGIESATPLLLVGLFGDQLRNATTAASHGSAIVLSKWRLHDVDYLERALREILHNDSYAENARRLAALVDARPFSPRELLVRYTQLIADHGPITHWTPASTSLSFVQRNFLDIIFLVFLAMVVCGCFLIALVEDMPCELSNYERNKEMVE